TLRSPCESARLILLLGAWRSGFATASWPYSALCCESRPGHAAGGKLRAVRERPVQLIQLHASCANHFSPAANLVRDILPVVSGGGTKDLRPLLAQLFANQV